MLAKFRCEEISLEIFNKFNEEVQPTKKLLSESKIINEFGKLGTSLLKAAIGNKKKEVINYVLFDDFFFFAFRFLQRSCSSISS
jgi:hypothetical protein